MIEWIKEKMDKKSSTYSSDQKIYDKSSPVSANSCMPSEETTELDPFRKTNRPFGCLINEIKYRYSFYLSDFKDAFNLHCLIAFVFIFTVCVAPALSFGGILGKYLFFTKNV